MVAVDIMVYFEKKARENSLKNLKQFSTDSNTENIFGNLPEVADQPPREKSRKKAAKLTGSPEKKVQRSKRVKNKRPDLASKVLTGEITLVQAEREITKEEVNKEIQLPSDKYRIIYADPPWKYNDTMAGELSEKYGGAEKHYPCMSIDELCALDIKGIIDDNAVLFIWTTSPMLEDSFKVIKAWGFKYKTSFIWDKVLHCMGHYNSVRHEFLLVCTKGSCTPDVKKLFDSVVTIERSKNHSEKPEEFRKMIDTLYPHGKRIELFARVSVDGWDGYGNQL